MSSTQQGSAALKENAEADVSLEPVPTPWVTPPPPPNGGVAAWMGVFAGFILFVTTWGFSTAYGAFQQYYQTNLLRDSSSSRLSWIGTVNAFFLISTGVIAGPLFDRGFLVHVMTAGCFLTTLGLMMLSLSHEYYQVLLSQGFCCGIGSGLIYVPALSLVSTSFTTRRGIAVGMVTTGASIGGVLFPVIFIRLQPRIGFPWTVRVMGFIQLACSCIAVPLLMVTTQPKRSSPRQLIHWHALREWHFDAYAIANFLVFMAYFIPLFYVPFFATQALHTSSDLSFYLVSVLNAGSAIGRLGSAMLTRWFPPALILLTSVVASAALLFGWVGITSLASFIVFCVLFGIFSGVLISANPLLIAHPVVSPTPAVIGTRMGMQWFATSVGVLIGAPIAGVLNGHDGGNGYFGLQVFSAAIMAAGAMFLLVPIFAAWRYDRSRKDSR
ncbi:putative MFS monocarboxylate transporter [Aspergillus affinis]|uniref:putative MFS monocarboxylate transporter n=1 Tax=Aspergillus affinis TaxID=1070780 RepID=UPI0022FDC5D5|nr:putative MFS monocarboxylate transporter [Aspergillus affinis]KAI9039423.1 putative MFS monocarboxylate transporter [Aspergillus affinis]